MKTLILSALTALSFSMAAQADDTYLRMSPTMESALKAFRANDLPPAQNIELSDSETLQNFKEIYQAVEDVQQIDNDAEFDADAREGFVDTFESRAFYNKSALSFSATSYIEGDASFGLEFYRSIELKAEGKRLVLLQTFVTPGTDSDEPIQAGVNSIILEGEKEFAELPSVSEIKNLKVIESKNTVYGYLE